ncbi:uncharacterized protein LOC135475078 [Liolophura sinensis]|uniref:uncharacterized protein LOC135475078 n=1 Tax=Liolophura sinensis TaxID=3198878 RepID=UPI0031584919
MLIYVTSESFPNKTFVSLVSAGDKIARVRAQMLHILNNIGRIDYQFRLYYKSQFLQDAFTLSDYNISDKAVVNMISMAGKNESVVADPGSHSSLGSAEDLGRGQPEGIIDALQKEINIFRRRERLVMDFRTLLQLHALASFLSVFTDYWYSVFWIVPLDLLGIFYAPQYTQVSGFVGSTELQRKVFCVVYGVYGLLNLGAAVTLASIHWISIQNNGCPEWEATGHCSTKTIFTAVFFTLWAVVLVLSDIIIWVLLWNFKFRNGDLVEKYLVQERDIEKVMHAAKFGKLREKRTAAYELAGMAASGDDNKFRIVAEGGLDVLNSMALGHDQTIQEHAIEALSELLTIPSIQDAFVETGGVRTLTALLHSPHPRVSQEAAMALYVVVSDSEENKGAVIAEHGLEDLAHAAYHGSLSCQRMVASIYLELAFNSEIRVAMAARNIPVQALIHLCKGKDPMTLRFSLQTLELLAIESPELIYAQEELLELLICLPLVTVEERLYLLAGKILLYYAENPETCEKMLDQEKLRECLSTFARSENPILQKVIAKVIFCTLDKKHTKLQARELKLDEILTAIKANPADRECWDMADQGLQVMNSEDEGLVNLPSLSTLEKVKRMGENSRSFGSRTSLQSGGSGSSLSSTSNVKKEQ